VDLETVKPVCHHVTKYVGMGSDTTTAKTDCTNVKEQKSIKPPPQ
jgi:hypothetical protein